MPVLWEGENRRRTFSRWKTMSKKHCPMPLTKEEEELLQWMPAWFQTLRKRFNKKNNEDLFRLIDYFAD